MGECADLLLTGEICQECGEWLEDIINGAPAPGYPRWCPSCKPRPPKPKKRLSHYEQMKQGLDIIAALPGVSVQTYENQGSYHLKFEGRFNIWPHPSRQPKWWDKATNFNGRGKEDFIKYVRHKLDVLAR